ncbi:serine hydrolase domain-containing protein [Embleya sp. NBC_00896]|uniref:serine hydrolase domain-containing protein n=1 Tax=Embleya sp. NBC_00896 TaxID=2975961 RepID=UPI00386DD3DB|nr:beta-lactamase family protein [Embleya sp. NBC_00896]
MTSHLSRMIVGVGVSGVLLLSTMATATATPADPPPATACPPNTPVTPIPVLPPPNPEALKAAIGDLTHPQAVSAQLRVAGPAGRWYGTSGSADLRTGRPVRPDDRFRAGSITKLFVAPVVLQLAAERRVDLDAPIQRYLPGLLPADYAPISLTNLLDHTSGLPDMVAPEAPDEDSPESIVAHRYDDWTPRRLVETQSGGPLKFAPGTKQEYRGVNYVLLALLIERITGRPYGDEIGRRLLDPLDLRDTSFPGHDSRIRGPQVRGYLRMSDGRLRDITVFNPSSSYGEGELISTTRDLDRYLEALFAGKLLPPAFQEKLFTLPSDDVKMLDGCPARYSQGLQTATVNGVTFWGKTGEQYGYKSAAFSTRDGQRRFVLSTTATSRKETERPMTARVAEALTKP